MIQQGLSIPWDIAFAPDGTMVVTERSGTIRVYESGDAGAQLITSLEVPDIRQVGESGLMGIAIDSDFTSNPFIYVCASRDADGEGDLRPWINELLRYRVSEGWALEFDGSLLPDPPRAFRQHNGCALEMDDSRKLWMTMGDTLKGSTTWPQDPNILNGKILRINADGSIPDDNPIFEGLSAPTWVYTMGHRNPQGIAFHPLTGQPYATEHGTGINDEINLIVAGSNYGWPCYTGEADVGHADPPPDCPPPSAFQSPAWASGDPTLATSGAVFLSHELWGDWQNNLIVACLKERDLRRFVVSEDGETVEMAETLLDEQFGRLRAAVVGPDGALYVSTSNQPNRSNQGQTPVPNAEADVIVRIAPTP